MSNKREIKKSAKDIMLAHSKAKVDFYQAYLTRYLSVMSVTPYLNTINIFDVFCGRGEYADGGLGSPIRAIQTIINKVFFIPANIIFYDYVFCFVAYCVGACC